MCSGLSGLMFHLFDCRGSFLVWVKVSFGSSELLNIWYSSCQAASHWYAPLFFSCEWREKAAVRMLIDSPPELTGLTAQVAHELESMWMRFHHSADHDRWKEVPSTMRNVSFILSSADVVNGEGVAGTPQGASHVVPRTLEMLCRAGAVQRHVLDTRGSIRLPQACRKSKDEAQSPKNGQSSWDWKTWNTNEYRKGKKRTYDTPYRTKHCAIYRLQIR